MIVFGIILIILGLKFYKYTHKSEIEDRENKAREKGIAVTITCGGVFFIIFHLIMIAS